MRRVAWVLLLALVVACMPGPAPVYPSWGTHVVAPAPPGQRHAEVSLTTKDGRAMPLRRVDVHAEMYGPLVFTSMSLYFGDAKTDTTEGRLALTLPAGASVAGVNYGDHPGREHIGVAPKVYESPSSNLFVARVPAGPGELRVSYLETRPTAFTPYRVLLAGLPRLATLYVRLRIPSLHEEYVLSTRDEAPAHDFVVVPPLAVPAAARSDRFALVRVDTAAPGASEPLGDVAVLIDSSASHAPTYAADIARAERLLKRLHTANVRVRTFDQEVVPATFAAASARRPLGASDLGAALAAAKGADRTILVTDGALELPAGVTASRIDVITGADADVQPFALAGRRSGAIVRPDDDDDAAVRALASPGGVIRRVEVAGAIGTWPTALALHGAASSSALAFVELPAASHGHARFEAPLAYVDPTGLSPIGEVEHVPSRLLEQVVLEAELRELEEQRRAKGPHADTALTERIVALAARLRALFASASPEVETNGGVRSWTSPPLSEPIPPDADGDGVPDLLDRCPQQPADPPDDPSGCSRGLVVIDSIHDFWLQDIRFEEGSAVVPPDQFHQIDFTAQNLERHREYQLMAVLGHADARERAPLALSQARAEAVRALLLQRGIAEERLIAKGVGTRWPANVEGSDFARMQNRRAKIAVLIAHGRSTQVEYVKELPALFPHNGKLAPTLRPYRGEFQSVVSALEQRNAPDAIARAEAWTRRAPEDVLAWVALGRALDASGDAREAARAYGSILELRGPHVAKWQRASRRRVAAGLLETLATRHPPALALAIEQYRRAAIDDPDAAISQRLHAWALAQQGDTRRALEVLAAAAPSFPDEAEAFRRDSELIAGRGPPAALLTWESAENSTVDVDLVGFDAKERPIYAPNDVTWGHGPELLPLEPRPSRIEVHLMAIAPDNHVIGKVMIVRPGAPVENRSFAMMIQGSRLAL